MAHFDVERGRRQSLSSESSEPSESSLSTERLSLLPPDFDRDVSNYKSTEVVTNEEQFGPFGNAEEQRRTKSVAAVISLLLVGNITFVDSREIELILEYRSLHLERGRKSCDGNIRHHLL
jgi:hypothetical protein